MNSVSWSVGPTQTEAHLILAARSLTITRGKKKVLDDVSIALNPGELVALVGPNGAGKTTLVEALIGSLKPSSGSIMLGQEPLHSYSASERARQIALLGRETTLHQSLQVRDVVALGRLPHRQGWGLSLTDTQLIDHAMKHAHCLEFACRPLHSLSDGEQQRVHWARALVQQTPTLLLDEATAHLDIAGRERSFSAARSFANAGGSMLAIAHELELAVRYASRLVVLHHGKIVASGPPETTLSRQLLAEVFGVNAEVRTGAGGLHLMIFGITE